MKLNIEYINNEDEFSSLWEFKISFRLMLQNLLYSQSTQFCDKNVLADTVSELLENQIKYSEDASVCILKISQSENNIQIMSKNESSLTNFKRMHEIVTRIETSDNLEHLYLQQLRLTDNESGIGLIKIALENRAVFHLDYINKNSIELLVSIPAQINGEVRV